MQIGRDFDGRLGCFVSARSDREAVNAGSRPDFRGGAGDAAADSSLLACEASDASSEDASPWGADGGILRGTTLGDVSGVERTSWPDEIGAVGSGAITTVGASATAGACCTGIAVDDLGSGTGSEAACPDSRAVDSNSSAGSAVRATCSRASRKASAEGKRSSGSLAIARMTRSLNGRGTAGLETMGASGYVCRCAVMIA